MGKSEAVCWSVRDGATERDWVRAHTALTRLARERAAADAEEGRWLLVAWRSSAHVHLGYGSFSEYVERLLGYSPRTTREKLRVAEALEALPLCAGALEQGRVTWCAARELTRVATAETEAAWLEAARGSTTRDLERLVSGKMPGEQPSRGDEPSPPQRHVLRFEVAAETYATFRSALIELRRAAGGPLDDDAALLEMARHSLGTPGDHGRSSYRITYQRCPTCGEGAQIAGGQPVAVGAEVLAMAACDGEHVNLQAPANENHSPPANELDGDVPTHPVPTSSAATSPEPSVAPLAHVGRARQAVAPALRRAVLLRDRQCCRVSGCKNSHFVDVHHIRPRAEGGRNTSDNLITLCTSHHRAAHRGDIIIEATGDGARFLHADGTPYGEPVAAAAAAIHAKVFSALRHLGFREREVHAVLAELRADTNQRDATAERLLREALRRIRPTKH
jgi:5-methylcytosine-specific restriction endonuclease McrA